MKKQPSLRLYLVLSYALFVLIVISALNLYWFSQQEQIAESALRNKLKERARMIATAFDSGEIVNNDLNLPPIYTAINTSLRTIYVTRSFEMRSLSDENLTDEQKTIVLDLAEDAMNGSTISREIYSENFTRESLYAAAPVFNSQGNVVGVVCVLLPLNAFEASISSARVTVLAFSVLVAVLSMPFGLALAELLTRRLSIAQRLTARVADGDYSLRLPENGPRELADLAHHLNRMAEELERQTEVRAFALSNVTHELTRPLGGLKLGVDTLRAGALNDPVLADDLLDEMERSITRMHTMVEDLALAGRPVNKPLPLNLCTVSLEAFIKHLEAGFRRRALARKVCLETVIPSDLPSITADEARLGQIMGNLVANALKYTPSGGRIILSASASEDHVMLGVQDTGPGIPEHDLGHVFEAFYRGENMNTNQPGMGIGLTIARQLAAAHGGSIELMTMPEGGLMAALVLPLSPETQSQAS